MRPFVSAKEMATLDEATIRARDHDSYSLMQEVSKEIFENLKRDYPDIKTSFHFFCGPGNNGGDGYSVAKYLQSAGYPVTVEALLAPKSPDCKKAAWSTSERPESVDVAVDAVFGNGSRAEVSDAMAEAFLWAKKRAKECVAIDQPSGMDLADKSADERAFVADQTFCVAFPKLNMWHPALSGFFGDVQMVGQNFKPPDSASFFLLEESDFHLPELPATTFKTKRGRVGVVAGSPNTPGAAFMSLEAAHRMGTGYAEFFYAKKSARPLEIELKQASFLFHAEWELSDLKAMDALVVGPGGAPEDLRGLESFSGPIVFDAEALREWPWSRPLEKKNWIVTPHPGEAKALLQENELSTDPVETLKSLVERLGCSVYLKGAPGILAFWGDPRIFTTLDVNPAFSRAGSGDILSGILGGALARNPQSFEKGVHSALVFQKALGQKFRRKPGVISTDLLSAFSESWIMLTR